MRDARIAEVGAEAREFVSMMYDLWATPADGAPADAGRGCDVLNAAQFRRAAHHFGRLLALSPPDAANNAAVASWYSRELCAFYLSKLDAPLDGWCADAALDPFPFGGGVTTLEAFSVCRLAVTAPSLQSVVALAAGFYRRLNIADAPVVDGVALGDTSQALRAISGDLPRK